ncbi:piggyBac transposable element-derived protein 4-like [Homalodisca vitripennis]|uniref:piggyBac transposable element-derived protein 4-like n=1 Tax=Homalodisca vitripennis TaxID=197043 RepID=UPI001EE9B734|nr:piggyBac transposable element-derived protein 4-like [Homalodisca vitripennis]
MAGLRDLPFTGQPGLLVPIPGDNKPIDWFNLLLDTVFLENIIRQTNLYALELFCGPTTTPASRITKWKDLVLAELRTFLGLLLLTGNVRLNRLNDYWKTHRLLNFPMFKEYMSRDRFLGILRCLHYSRVDTPDHPEPANNRSFKIQNIVEYFNNKMRQIYYPDRELTIDEEMVLWRGRLVFRQYVKGKRHKYGIKIYSLNEPEGLMLRFHVYTGSHDSCSGKGHTVKVVMKLMRDFLGKGHSLFMDNFYNSFVLSSKLLRHSTYTTGTLRIDRLHTPPAVKAKALGKGETIANYAQSVMIGKWRDKRTVTYISTQYDNEMVQTTNRRNQKRTLPKPIMYYNSYMKGTDRLDQMVSYYPCERKNLRWHKKIFVHFLQVVVVNSFYLYNMYNSDRLSLYDFRVRVLEDLLPPKEAPLLITPTRNSMHRLSKSMKRKGNGKSVTRRCRVCYQEGKRKETVYYCAVCPDEPALCELGCFDKYHEGK